MSQNIIPDLGKEIKTKTKTKNNKKNKKQKQTYSSTLLPPINDFYCDQKKPQCNNIKANDKHKGGED